MSRPTQGIHSLRDGIEGKTCTQCKQWKPVTEYYRHHAAGDGLHWDCKICAYSQKVKRDKEKLAARLALNPPISTGEHSVHSGIEGKVCFVCGQWHPLSRYYRRKMSGDGLMPRCKTCDSMAKKRRYRADPDKVLAKCKQWALAYPDRKKAINAKYAKAHPEMGAAKRRRYRARKVQAQGVDYTTVQHIQDRWAMYGDRCWICGALATQTDHVKPLAKGGAHWPCNLRPACDSCNGAKQDTWPFANPRRRNILWAQEQGGGQRVVFDPLRVGDFA